MIISPCSPPSASPVKPPALVFLKRLKGFKGGGIFAALICALGHTVENPRSASTPRSSHARRLHWQKTSFDAKIQTSFCRRKKNKYSCFTRKAFPFPPGNIWSKESLFWFHTLSKTTKDSQWPGSTGCFSLWRSTVNRWSDCSEITVCSYKVGTIFGLNFSKILFWRHFISTQSLVDARWEFHHVVRGIQSWERLFEE